MGARWTPAERARLADVMEAGATYAEAGAALGRTAKAVCQRWFHERRGGGHGYLMTGRVAALMGVSVVVVRRWVREGFLPSEPSNLLYAPGKRRPAVTMAGLRAFLCDTGTWALWRPEAITDAPLRAWALELRRDGPRWLTSDEAGRLLAYDPTWVETLARRGSVPARKLPAAGSGRPWRWFLREADVDAFARGLRVAREGEEAAA